MIEYHSAPKRRISSWIFLLALVLVSFVCFLYVWFIQAQRAPAAFPVNTVVTIHEGTTVKEAAELLAKAHAVRSPFVLYLLLQMNFSQTYIQAGSYQFTEPLTSHEIASAITTGTYATIAQDAVTFPEGFRIANMHTYLPETLTDAPLPDPLKYEGYLFPDTYFIAKNDTFADVLLRMEREFVEKTEPLAEQIAHSSSTLEEVVTLASILEREANDEVSMRTVAGILKNRIALGMPLQVDATLEYILGKGSAELTSDDLAIESPYNTYRNTGLPPTPIANPGMTALHAVLDPIETEYLYYLTGSDGTFHYAETFEEHKLNKARYLDFGR